MATASPPPQPQPPPSFASSRSYDLEITVISAKHLKNVNWRHGDLKPYAVAYLHPDRRSATKPDDSGSTRPVWNERLSLPLPVPFSPHDPTLLTLDIFHSKPSETPKPLVGSARVPLKDLIGEDNFLSFNSSNLIKTIKLSRPSGRPHGKVRIKLSICEKPAPPLQEPNYQFPPPPPTNVYYSVPRDAYHSYSPPSPPTSQHIMPYSHYINYIPPRPSQYPYPSYSGHYSAYYSSNPPYYVGPPARATPHGPVSAPASLPDPARSSYNRPTGYSGLSAPVDYTPRQSSYDDISNSGKFGAGTGLAVGAVTGAFGFEEGIKYEEEKIAGKVESEHGTRVLPLGPVSVPPPSPDPTRSYYNCPTGYSGPSAPVHYTPRQSSYDDRSSSGKFGAGTGLVVGSVAGAFGAMGLEEGIKYEEEKIAGKVESDHGARGSYSECRTDY